MGSVLLCRSFSGAFFLFDFWGSWKGMEMSDESLGIYLGVSGWSCICLGVWLVSRYDR